MTKSEFTGLCAQYTVDPAVALENEQVTLCLIEMRDNPEGFSYDGYRNALIRLLETEF